MTQHKAPEPLTVAQLLAQNPRAAEALERSIAKQEAQKEVRREREVPSGACPHCKTVGSKSYTVAGRVFHVRSSTCCQRAACDDAIASLRYFFNPQGVPALQDEAGVEYNRLRGKITDPGLLAKLDAEADALSGIGERVSAEGGYCQRSPKPKQDGELRIVYDPAEFPEFLN